jgi:CheY-like chemotaxis protein
MAGEDGYALIRQARALGVKNGFWFPAVALTAYTQSENLQRSLSAGFQAHLTKPIDPQALIEVAARLAGRTSSS